MIRFLIIGLLRDKTRSRLPVLVVAIGVALSVFMHAYVTGVINDSIEETARFNSGHLKIMSKSYAELESQMPVDLMLLESSSLIDSLKIFFSDYEWSARIRFGALVDVPDSVGETRAQGPSMCFSMDILNPDSKEIDRFHLRKSLIKGQLPQNSNEILLSNSFAQKLGVEPNDQLSLITSTINGTMSITNFTLAGTLNFGSKALDRGTIILDLSSARLALDAADGAGEILGFEKSGYFNQESVVAAKQKFNAAFPTGNDPFEPQMKILTDEPNLALFVRLGGNMSYLISLIFIIAMSLVLWNAGLLGGLRRYGEFGVRLAIGEEKRHLYRTLIWESLFVGIIGTVIGTAVGLGFAWLLQKYGLNIDDLMKGNQSSIMMPGRIRARITPADFYIGFFPGVMSTLIGSALSGLGIYKRQTAKLFKELE